MDPATISAALSVLSAMGGGSKISASRAETRSGLGNFSPNNKVKKNQAIIDFNEPLQVGALAVVIVLGIYIYKKVR